MEKEASFDVKIPATQKSYFKESDKPGNLEIIHRIKTSDYFKWLTTYAEVAKVPADLLIAVIAIESAGKNAPKNKWGAIGLMQMKVGTAYDTIKLEAIKKQLTAADKAIIKKFVPAIAKNGYKVLYGDFTGLSMPQVNKELEAALMKPEFSLLMGALHIGQMIDKFTTIGGKAMVHKSLAIYNQGIGRTALVKPFDSVDDFINKSKIASEGKNYVLKALGKNGYLDLLLP